MSTRVPTNASAFQMETKFESGAPPPAQAVECRGTAKRTGSRHRLPAGPAGRRTRVRAHAQHGRQGQCPQRSARQQWRPDSEFLVT